MKPIYSILIAIILSPVVLHAERGMQSRLGGPYEAEARQDFRNSSEENFGGAYEENGFYPGIAPPTTYRQTPQYQEETLQNAGDPMQEEELQNINDMSNEPDIG